MRYPDITRSYLTRLARMAPVTLLLFLSACSAIQPLGNYARTGDTVSIAVYPTDGLGVIKKEQASVSLTDAAQVVHPVTLRNVFRVYSDPSSRYSLRAAKTTAGWSSAAPIESYANAYQGQWLAIVDLVNPATGVADPLATGPATLVFTTPNSPSPATSTLEILPGLGKRNRLDGNYNYGSYAPVSTLEPTPQVSVDFTAIPTAPLGGGTFVVNYDTATFGASNTSPWAVVTSPDPNIQLIANTVPLANGTTDLRVSVLNPHGFQTDDANTGLVNQMSKRSHLAFTIIWDPSLTTVTDANWPTVLRLTRGYYFDLNGTPVPSLTPTLTKVR